MAHTELNLRERRVIDDMLNAKISVRDIATEIGRHVSTLYVTSSAMVTATKNCQS